MTMRNNAKFEKELTCHFNTDMRNLTNFDSSTRKSKIFLGYDSCFKISLILWYHIMNNFQVKHDQYDSIIFLNTFSLEISKQL